MEAVTTFFLAWWKATIPATSSMYLIIAPPKTLPRTFPSVGIISLTVVIWDTETCLPPPLRLIACCGAARWLIKLIRRLRETKPLEYITPEEMSELERGAAEYGLSVKELMENAGGGVADFVLSRFGSAERVCVVCGGGNNGGDGFVAARHLAARCVVDVVLLTPPDKIRTEEARENWRALEGTGASLHVAEDEAALERVAGLSRLR